MRGKGAATATVAIVLALAPAAAAASAIYASGTFIATCYGPACDDAGVGVVALEVPDDVSSVSIEIHDATDPAGLDQPGEYNFQDASHGMILDEDVDFCDSASAWIPANAEKVVVTVWSGAIDATGFSPADPCPGLQAATVGEVTAAFS